MSIKTEELSGLANDWAAARLGGDTDSLKEILALSDSVPRRLDKRRLFRCLTLCES